MYAPVSNEHDAHVSAGISMHKLKKETNLHGVSTTSVELAKTVCTIGFQGLPVCVLQELPNGQP